MCAYGDDRIVSVKGMQVLCLRLIYSMPILDSMILSCSLGSARCSFYVLLLHCLPSHLTEVVAHARNQPESFQWNKNAAISYRSGVVNAIPTGDLEEIRT